MELPVVITVFSRIYVRYAGRYVSREAVINFLIQDAERLFGMIDKTVSHPVIIGTEHNTVVSLETESQLIVIIAYTTGAIKRSINLRIVLLLRNLGKTSLVSPYLSVVQRCRDRRRSQHLLTVTGNIIRQFVSDGNG